MRNGKAWDSGRLTVTDAEQPNLVRCDDKADAGCNWAVVVFSMVVVAAAWGRVVRVVRVCVEAEVLVVEEQGQGDER